MVLCPGRNLRTATACDLQGTLLAIINIGVLLLPLAEALYWKRHEVKDTTKRITSRAKRASSAFSLFGVTSRSSSTSPPSAEVVHPAAAHSERSADGTSVRSCVPQATQLGGAVQKELMMELAMEVPLPAPEATGEEVQVSLYFFFKSLPKVPASACTMR